MRAQELTSVVQGWYPIKSVRHIFWNLLTNAHFCTAINLVFIILVFSHPLNAFICYCPSHTFSFDCFCPDDRSFHSGTSRLIRNLRSWICLYASTRFYPILKLFCHLKLYHPAWDETVQDFVLLLWHARLLYFCR